MIFPQMSEAGVGKMGLWYCDGNCFGLELCQQIMDSVVAGVRDIAIFGTCMRVGGSSVSAPEYRASITAWGRFDIEELSGDKETPMIFPRRSARIFPGYLSL